MGMACDHSCKRHREIFMNSMNCRKKQPVVQPEMAAFCASNSAWLVFKVSIYKFAAVGTAPAN